jgi:hypothetical protein
MHEKINKIPFKGVFDFFFIKRKTSHLGRWSYLSHNEIMERIDRSNVDNCGISYLIKNNTVLKNNTKKYQS